MQVFINNEIAQDDDSGWDEMAFVTTDAHIRAWARLAHQERRTELQARQPEAHVDEHRLDASPSIQLADWYSDAPLAYGESNVPTVEVEDTEWVDGGYELTVDRYAPWDELYPQPYTIETWKALDDVATARWLHRDDERVRVRWSEQDEREIVLGRLRWIVDVAARKHRCTRREAVVRFPAAKAAMQEASALKARWNFQHEIYRAGAAPTKEVTAWCKAAFGRTYTIALQEIRRARRDSQRQPFAAVRAELI